MCVCVCECWCCLWRKVHDHEANYLAKLGESLALSGDEVALFKLCNSATILVVDVLSSVERARLFGLVWSGLPACLMSCINQRCHCLNLKSTFKQTQQPELSPISAETTQPRPDSYRPVADSGRQPQHESLMISAND